MTLSIKQREVGKCYVTVRALDTGYDVGIYKDGQTVRRNYYGTEKQALRCFYRYCKQARNF